MRSPTPLRLRRLLRGPPVPDEERTRLGWILHILLLAGCLFAVLDGLQVLPITEADPPDLAALLLALFCGALLLPLHRGHIHGVGLVLLFTFWGASIHHTYNSGGVTSPGVGTQVLLIVASALLFGRRTLVAFLALNIGSLTAMYVLQLRGLLPEPTPAPLFVVFITYIVQLALAGLLIALSTRSQRQILDRARAGELRAEQLSLDAQNARKYADNILASMAESLIVLDALDQIQDVNHATLKLLGTPKGPLIGRPFTTILPALGTRSEDLASPMEAPVLIERSYRSPSGREIPVLFAHTLLRDDRERPIGSVCVASDITHIKRAEAGLREAKELAEEANLAKSRFLANMSHELRTPLNAVIGYAEMLLEEASERNLAASLDELRKIQFAGKHLLGLISDILDLSKIEAGRMDIHLETFDVADMVQTVLGTLRPLADRNGNELRYHVPLDIGFIHADQTKIRQILLNLLSNAIKFTDRNLVQLDVTTSPFQGRPGIQFTVSDKGIGMTPQQISKLFQAFSQADSGTARRFGGTGLGLAISKAFCDMLGGTISVSSQRGSGTTFLVRLPYTDPSDVSITRQSGNFPRVLADIARTSTLRVEARH